MNKKNIKDVSKGLNNLSKDIQKAEKIVLKSGNKKAIKVFYSELKKLEKILK